MIVVAIIGVLAALAVPKFQSFQAKAKQSEAKSNLSHIYTLEQSYYGDQDKYSSVLADIGFSLQGHVRYGYSVLASGANLEAFVATALATNNNIIASGCPNQDKWEINQLKQLYLRYDCVKGAPGPATPM